MGFWVVLDERFEERYDAVFELFGFIARSDGEQGLAYRISKLLKMNFSTYSDL